jgi:hypothetical protein
MLCSELNDPMEKHCDQNQRSECLCEGLGDDLLVLEIDSTLLLLVTCF